MSAETAFRALLVSHAPLVSLVGSAIALNAVPEGANAPLVVFSATHNPTRGLDGTLLVDQVTFSAQCWAATAAAADAIADALVAAVATAPAARAALMLDRNTSFDAELGLDCTALTFDWWQAD